jgi:hypothetical protein
MLWLARHISDYTAPAERALANEQVRQVTLNYYIPGPEATLRIECEPDIVRPSALYLLHPVHMALKALHPDITILCMSEPYGDVSRKIRPDIVYKKNGVVFAILEYKVPGAMVKNDFDKAKMPWQSPKEEIDKKKAIASKKLDFTLFGEKSTVLMKQVSRYVDINETTRYAALFNWDFMFLTVYDEPDSELIYGTLISRTDRNTADKLRKSYLGWLMEALDNEGACKLDPPGGRHLPSDGTSQPKRDGSGPNGGHGNESSAGPNTGSNTGSHTASPGASDRGPTSGDQASNSGNTDSRVPSRRKPDSGNDGKTVTAPVHSRGLTSTARQVTGGKPVASVTVGSPLRHEQVTHGKTTSKAAPAQGGQQPATSAKAQPPQHSGPAKKAQEPIAMQPASQHGKPAKKTQQGTESSSAQSPASAAVAKMKKSADLSSVRTRSQKHGG